MHEYQSPYQSQDITTLAKALLAVQAQLQPALKDAENTFTKSYYATLNSVMESCRNALLSNGIWLTQFPIPAPEHLGGGYLGLMTKLTHAESGQWQSSLAVVPLPKNDPQGMGIAMTYTRRYALCAMLGMVTEDDDGEGAKLGVKQAGSVKRGRNTPQTQNTPPSTPPDKGQIKITPQNRHHRRVILLTSLVLTASTINLSLLPTDALASSRRDTLSPRRSCSWARASSGIPNARCGGSMLTPHRTRKKKVA